jgi:hypothetical protein
MGNLGVGFMDSMTSSSASRSNPTVDKSQISFRYVDFQPHLPTLIPIFGNLDQEMNLIIRSFNFRIGFLGTLRLSDPISLGSSANKTAAAATSETSIGSSSEANSPVSIALAKCKKSIVEPLDKIMENFNFKESSDIRSEENPDNIRNYSE